MSVSSPGWQSGWHKDRDICVTMDAEPTTVCHDRAVRDQRLGCLMVSEWSTRFMRDGVLAGVRVLSEDEAGIHLDELDAIRDGILADPRASVSDLSHLHYEGQEHPLFPWVDRLARDERLLGPVRALLGPDVLIRNGDVFAKELEPLDWIPIPGFVAEGQGIGWHRDDVGEGTETQAFMTAWVALTPANETNGALRYLEGSHRVPLPRPPLDRASLTMVRENLEVLEACNEMVVDLRPGECVLHGGHVVHSSRANEGSSRRVGIAIRYMRADADPELAGCGTAALAAGTGNGGRFSLQSNYTINWWTPSGAASGWRKVQSTVKAEWGSFPGGGDRVVMTWETPEMRESVQGIGVCIPGTTVHAWVDGAPDSFELSSAFTGHEGEALVVVAYRDRTHSRQRITRGP